MSYTNYVSKPTPFILTYLVDLVRYRHLCWNLVASDLRARFRRSRLGMLWAVVMPLSFALLIALVWGQVFQQESFWTFTVYVFSGMLVWEYFSVSINVSLDSLLNAAGYLRTARIPLLVFQLRVPLTSLVVFFFGFIGLICLMAPLGVIPMPGPHLLLVPAFVVLLVMLVTPLSIIFSFLGTQYRDIRYISALVLQALFFVSPVMLQREVLERPELQILFYINPMIPLLKLFRDPVLHGQMWDTVSLYTIAAWIGGLWVIAIFTSIRFGRKIIFAI